MGFLNIFGFGVVYLICTLSFTKADPCVAKSPCSCVFSNGTGIDLTPAISSEFYTADTYAIKLNGTQYEMSTYFYHPCYDVSMNVSMPNPKSTCTSPLSVSSTLKFYDISLLFEARMLILHRYRFHHIIPASLV